jgi:hypothetical protein
MTIAEAPTAIRAIRATGRRVRPGEGRTAELLRDRRSAFGWRAAPHACRRGTASVAASPQRPRSRTVRTP